MESDRPTNRWHIKVLSFILLLHHTSGCQVCQYTAVGIVDSNIIPDSSITASSELKPKYAVTKARFNSDTAWEPNGNANANDYLQIDLGKVFVICAVATKGSANTAVSEWTKKYKISTSIDGTTWTLYPANSSPPRIFPGNTNRNTAVKNVLDESVQAKLIRFTPTDYHVYKALRVEVYGTYFKGCPVCPSTAVGIVDSNIIPDSSMTASSELQTKYPLYAAKKARFNSHSAWAPNGNGDPDDFLQIDLGKVFVICAVATKGNARDLSVDEWTKEYNISTSIDGRTWTWHSNNNSTKPFPGNSDRNTAVRNVLDVPVQAKFIRFTPTAYHGYKALRVEVYGIDFKAFSCKSLPVGIASVAKIVRSDMTSSTKYNTSTPASNGRLGYTAGSSWCAATSDYSPYLQINLGSPYVICGVATQGDHKSDQWVQIYQIQTSTDGSTFTDYKQNNIVNEFNGNVGSYTTVQNLLYDEAVGQYVRIQPKSNYGSTSCMRAELYGVHQKTVCSKKSTGIPYSTLVPDHRFTASSSFITNPADKYSPSKARLNSPTAWEPKTKTQNKDWLQIDLGPVVYVCAVATQGNGYAALEWAEKYKLRVSLDNIIWKYYKEKSVDKVFIGNTDRTIIVTNTLTVPIKAKFIRFYPTEHEKYAAMRVDVYGVPAAGSSPFGLENGGSIQNNTLASSSVLDSSHNASHGRLYGGASWCSSTSSNTEYIQNDLGKMVTLTGIATQGDHTMDKWVKNYTLKYSIDGKQWGDYMGDQNTAKVLQGNSDRSSIVVKWLSHPITVRYVRVHPQSWNTGICMRIELFGCTSPSTPNIIELSNQNLTATSNSHVEFTCKVQEPLIQYIEWYSDCNNVTSLSGGMKHGVNYVKSVLRVNYTNAEGVCTQYQCSKEASFVVCRRNIVCRTKYAAAYGDADSIKGAEVYVKLEYPSAPTLYSVINILTKSANIHWTRPSLKVSQASVEGYVIKYWNHQTTKTVTVSHSATSHIITGLSVCTHYNVTIKAVSKCGDGSWSNTTTFRTDSEIPKTPTGVTAQAKSSQSILVKWQVPVGVYCPPDEYQVIYSPTSEGSSQNRTINGGQTTSYYITNLNKWTIYSIKLRVHNEKGYGTESTALFKRTLEDKPDATPLNFAVSAKNSTSVHLTWDLPPADKRNGIIRGFKLSYCKKSSCNSSSLLVNIYPGNSTRQYILSYLDMYTEYSFKVLAYTIEDGPYTNIMNERTDEGPPSVPQNITTSAIEPVGSSGPKVKLIWERPEKNNGIIRGYNVSYGKSGDSNIITRRFDEKTFTTDLDVCGGVSYAIKVWAFTVIDGKIREKTFITDVYAPPAPEGGTITNINGSAANITLWKISAVNGQIREVLVYVKEVQSGTKTRRASEEAIPDCAKTASDSFKLDPDKTVFTLGDEKMYGTKKNEKLLVGKQYKVYQCGATNNKQISLYGEMSMIAEGKVDTPKGNTGEHNKPNNPDTALVASLVSVFLLVTLAVVIAVAIFFWRRKRNSQANDNIKLDNLDDVDERNSNENNRGEVAPRANAGYVDNEQRNAAGGGGEDENAGLYGNAEMIGHRPIPVNRFNQYVNEKGDSLYNEFKLLSNGQLFPWTAAKNPSCKPKNRYGNIITYDHSRVVLQDSSDGSDYINASYIHVIKLT